jgi:hypothetical protein
MKERWRRLRSRLDERKRCVKTVAHEVKEWQYDAEMAVWRCRRLDERLLDCMNWVCPTRDISYEENAFLTY